MRVLWVVGGWCGLGGVGGVGGVGGLGGGCAGGGGVGEGVWTIVVEAWQNAFGGV